MIWIVVYDPVQNQVTGPATINGTIDVSGQGTMMPTQAAGAGGGILIEANTVRGSGTLKANGQNGYMRGGASGGGIISLIGNNGFSGNISAAGGGAGSCAGCTEGAGGNGIVSYSAAPASGY